MTISSAQRAHLIPYDTYIPYDSMAITSAQRAHLIPYNSMTITSAQRVHLIPYDSKTITSAQHAHLIPYDSMSITSAQRAHLIEWICGVHALCLVQGQAVGSGEEDVCGGPGGEHEALLDQRVVCAGLVRCSLSAWCIWLAVGGCGCGG